MWANSSATDPGLPASVARAMARSRCSSASQQPDSIIVGGQVGQIKNLAEVAAPLVFPTLGDDHGFDRVGGGAPALFRRLMQVAPGQVLPALGQEVARLIHVARNCLDVGCGHRSSFCRGCAVGCGLSFVSSPWLLLFAIKADIAWSYVGLKGYFETGEQLPSVGLHGLRSPATTFRAMKGWRAILLNSVICDHYTVGVFYRHDSSLSNKSRYEGLVTLSESS